MKVIDIIGRGLYIFIQIYTYILLGRIIFSFFQTAVYTNPAMSNFYRVLYGLTEPLLAPIRRVVPLVRLGAGYLDLSPVILLILLGLVRQFIVQYIIF